jgi:uncharacterized protein
MRWIDIKKSVFYDGSQLSSRWVSGQSRSGHVVITFVGPCDVDRRFMVDLEDLKNKKSIRSDLMLHFIVRHSDVPLPFIVTCQRLFIAIVQDILEKTCGEKIAREGDDLFYMGGKLSISVATQSRDRKSGLFHAALNITSEGTPPEVRTASLDRMGITVPSLKKRVVLAYMAEWDSIKTAATKVRTV